MLEEDGEWVQIHIHSVHENGRECWKKMVSGFRYIYIVFMRMVESVGRRW